MEIFMTTQSVELLCLTQRAPLLLHGTIAQSETHRWVFTSDEPVELDVIDCNAIVNAMTIAAMTLHIVKQEDETRSPYHFKSSTWHRSYPDSLSYPSQTFTRYIKIAN